MRYRLSSLLISCGWHLRWLCGYGGAD